MIYSHIFQSNTSPLGQGEAYRLPQRRTRIATTLAPARRLGGTPPRSEQPLQLFS